MDPVTKQEIFGATGHATFRETALKVFYDQSVHVPVYRDYLSNMGFDPGRVEEVEAIPFLPIEFFRTHEVLREGKKTEHVFRSSGTTASSPSIHHLADPDLYLQSLTMGFSMFYGDPGRYCILALFPSFREKESSSLAYMLDRLIRLSNHPDSGFYMDRIHELSSVLEQRNRDRQETLLLGVSYALLDLAEHHPLKLGDQITVMETGGMKGRRKELVREELHQILIRAFGRRTIHSEYGMTELLSQAYSKGMGRFRTPPWMRVLLRDPNDPLTLIPPCTSGHGRDAPNGETTGSPTGGINIIDLANLHSCSFIATGDLGKIYRDGSFEVLGRFDHSDIRGCNLLA